MCTAGEANEPGAKRQRRCMPRAGGSSRSLCEALERRATTAAKLAVLLPIASPPTTRRPPAVDALAVARAASAAAPKEGPAASTPAPVGSSNFRSTGTGDGKQKPFRTLVVVPRSHSDGTFERLCGGTGGTGKVQCKDHAIARRAVQLDLRPHPDKRHRSLFVAWDSRVVHQGHTHGAVAGGWDPPLHRPGLFPAAEAAAWLSHLKEEGYAVVTDPLGEEDVEEALRLLLRDLQLLCPELKSLGEVREWHLPPTSAANDLRGGAGLCHGEFAWFLRSRPQVTRIFEQLFGLPPGAPLTGSVDVLALAPPGSAARHGRGKQWLHLDYTPPQGRICQACLQVFPHGEAGEWERIALMVCKAPVQWTLPRAEHSLLACCVAGAASRATAGVTLGKMHAEGRESPTPGRKRLLPALEGAALAAAQAPSEGETAKSRLRWLTPQELVRRLPAEELRRLLPETVLRHVSPQALLPALRPRWLATLGIHHFGERQGLPVRLSVGAAPSSPSSSSSPKLAAPLGGPKRRRAVEGMVFTAESFKRLGLDAAGQALAVGKLSGRVGRRQDALCALSLTAQALD